jgi:glyoxylase-like metal-dependent hydrolase (beta-lactamase superfamily II)
MDTEPRSAAPTTSRRWFLAYAGAVATLPTASALLGKPLSSNTTSPQHATSTSYAPVPPGSLGPALNADGYFVGNINGSLYWVTDSVYQAMFLATREGVVMVDAPPTIGHNLLRAVADVTKTTGTPANITHLVYSHSHADHIGASALLGSDVVHIGHSETRKLLLRDNDANRPAPTVTFEDEYDLRVGDELLQLRYHGPNHTPDNIFISAPDHQTLMLVDVIFPGWVPFKNLAVSQDIPDWVNAQEIAMSYPWTTYVGGHLGRLGTRADGELQIDYVADLLAEARATMASLDPAPFFAQYGDNSWAIFKAYLDAASTMTAAPVTAKYLSTLAGADVFTLDNAYVMFEALRVDYGTLGPFGDHK